MEKKLIVLGVICAFVMTLSVSALAATQKATLINEYGDKVVVAVNSSEAQYYFRQGYKLPEAINKVNNEEVGAVSAGYFMTQARFTNSFVKGGKITDASSTLSIAKTLTADQICNSKTITVNSAAVATTLMAASTDITTPATSTLFGTCLKSNNDEITFDFINQSPTAASTTEIVAGTGCRIVYGVADGDATIPGQKGATITIKRIKDWLADGGSKDCIVKVYEWN